MELRKLEYYFIQHPEDKNVNPERIGDIYLGMAELFDEAEDVEQAIIYQKKAYERFSSMDKYADTFKLADVLYTMGDYLEEGNHNNDAVNVMMLAAKIYEGILPRTSQVNRKID